MHPCEEMMVFSLTIESFPELTYSPTLHLYSSISNKIGLIAHISKIFLKSSPEDWAVH